MLRNKELTIGQMGVQVLRMLLQTESRIGERARAALRGARHYGEMCFPCPSRVAATTSTSCLRT